MITIPNIDELITRYVAGEHLKTLSSEQGIAYMTLRAHFTKRGIALRGKPEAQRLRAEKREREVLAETHRKCLRCKETKPADAFRLRLNAAGRQIRNSRCLACESRVISERRENDPEFRERLLVYHRQRDQDPVTGPPGAYVRKRNQAARRGLSFSLSLADFCAVYTTTTCPICSRAIGGQWDRREGVQPLTLDRIDNTRGYEPGNVAALCLGCNQTKGEHTPETWLAMVERMTAYITAAPSASPLSAEPPSASLPPTSSRAPPLPSPLPPSA